jgi:hypothetical protein
LGFQPTPHEVQAFLDTFQLPYDLRHTQQPTCETASGFSTIDFYIIHRALTEVTSIPTLVHNHSLKHTHTPCTTPLETGINGHACTRHATTAQVLSHPGHRTLWPVDKFNDIWEPITTQIREFEHRHDLERSTSPLQTTTPQHTDEITQLIQKWATTSLSELAPACGIEKAPMQQVQTRATTARQALATKQSIRAQPSIALQRIARALHNVNHPYTPARGHELATQLKALDRASTRAWIHLHLADCPTRPGIDQLLHYLTAITARYDAYIHNIDMLSGARLPAHGGLLRLTDPLFIAWADLLQTHSDLTLSATLTTKSRWSLSGSSLKRLPKRFS